jgi:hypothetical protein
LETILYICSLNIVLKFRQTKKKQNFMKKIVFKDYYQELSNKERSELKGKLIPCYMQYSTFYYKVKNNLFTELEFEKLESITRLSLKRN